MSFHCSLRKCLFSSFCLKLENDSSSFRRRRRRSWHLLSRLEKTQWPETECEHYDFFRGRGAVLREFMRRTSGSSSRKRRRPPAYYFFSDSWENTHSMFTTCITIVMTIPSKDRDTSFFLRVFFANALFKSYGNSFRRWKAKARFGSKWGKAEWGMMFDHFCRIFPPSWAEIFENESLYCPRLSPFFACFASRMPIKCRWMETKNKVAAARNFYDRSTIEKASKVGPIFA